jgi:histidine triad (HIT) family protein
MDNCVFCKIITGQSPASIFYQDDLVLGLMTISPVNDGHALIIPKQHAAYLIDLDEAAGRHLWTITQRTAAAIRTSTLRCEGVNLFLADGAAAFQEIFHLHMHVFPRFAGDDFRLEANWSYQPTRHALDQAAGAIKAAYARLFNNTG